MFLEKTFQNEIDAHSWINIIYLWSGNACRETYYTAKKLWIHCVNCFCALSQHGWEILSRSLIDCQLFGAHGSCFQVERRLWPRKKVTGETVCTPTPLPVKHRLSTINVWRREVSAETTSGKRPSGKRKPSGKRPSGKKVQEGDDIGRRPERSSPSFLKNQAPFKAWLPPRNLTLALNCSTVPSIVWEEQMFYNPTTVVNLVTTCLSGFPRNTLLYFLFKVFF